MAKYQLTLTLSDGSTITTTNALQIPSNVSELSNDVGYITSYVNYYPSRVYSSGLQLSSGVGSTLCALYVPYMTASQYGVAKAYAVRSSAITATTGGTTSDRYYGVEKDSNGKLFVNVPWTSGSSGDNDHYPTGFTWTDGTTAGPTGSLTGNTGFTAVSFPAIPAASNTQSGIITTSSQNLKGLKTFYSGGVAFTNANYTIPPISLESNATNVLRMYFNGTTNATLKMATMGVDTATDGSYLSLINDMYSKKIELRGYVSGTSTPWTSYLLLPQSKGTSANYATIATTDLVTASTSSVSGATIAQSININGTNWNLPSGGTSLDKGTEATQDGDVYTTPLRVRRFQQSFGIVQNLLTNINGHSLSSNYNTFSTTIGGYPVVKIIYRSGGANLAYQDAANYLRKMVGSEFVPTFGDGTVPQFSYIIDASGVIYKPQYDSTNGLVLYITGQLALTSSLPQIVDLRGV